MSAANSSQRNPAYPVDPRFTERWSPRAFLPQPLPDSHLLTMLEAARWAPSAYNLQPWRFLYSIRDDEHWERFVDLLNPFNASWAANASALILVISDSTTTNPETGEVSPARYHHFDTGAAWAMLALQATTLGYQTHAMAGVDFDRARAVLKIPAHFAIEVAIAVGTPASPDTLPETLRERERPSNRRPLFETAFGGGFPA